MDQYDKAALIKLAGAALGGFLFCLAENLWKAHKAKNARPSQPEAQPGSDAAPSEKAETPEPKSQAE